MKTENNTEGKDKIKLTAIMIVSLLVIATGTLFSLMRFMKGDVAGGVTGALIAIIVLVFAISVLIRANRDLKKGVPWRDERSRKVIEKASSMAFYVSIYMLLAIGWLSEDVIHFRDVSQATGLAIGIMAILFAVFWVYYNRKEI
nr:hypothetical protein [Nanoarchaeota archaeon]